MKLLGRVVIAVVMSAILAMWVYGFFFASREAVNSVNDSDWQRRSEAICLSAKQERFKLIDLSLVKDSGPDALLKRADIVDKATATLATMVEQIATLPVASAKGAAIAPLWLADYRVYIADRYSYTALLRNGVNEPFAETIADGLPLSEKLATFAADNKLNSCKPPIDLSV
jgi:hypothetical protein